jgi:hypothetical protein
VPATYENRLSDTDFNSAEFYSSNIPASGAETENSGQLLQSGNESKFKQFVRRNLSRPETLKAVAATVK